MFRRRGNGTCTHTMCDIVARNKPERSIGFVCESVALFERHFGQDYKEEIREMSLDALSKYGPGTPFERDERMLPVYRILGRYSKSMTPSELYDRLYEKNLFEKSAQFFVDWADAHLAAKNPTRAAQIIAHADTAVGADHPLLETMKETIERAMVERMMADGSLPSSRPPAPPSALDAAMADMKMHGTNFLGRPPLAPPPNVELRRVLAPIQAPPRAAAPAPTTEQQKPAAAAAADEKFVLPVPRATADVDDGSCDKENARPVVAQLQQQLQQHMQQLQQPAQQQQRPEDDHEVRLPPPPPPARRPVVPITATTFLLPTIGETAPISPDMISPSLAQMKPGRPNNFILPPVFTFADAARPKPPAQ